MLVSHPSISTAPKAQPEKLQKPTFDLLAYLSRAQDDL